MKSKDLIEKLKRLECELQIEHKRIDVCLENNINYSTKRGWLEWLNRDIKDLNTLNLAYIITLDRLREIFPEIRGTEQEAIDLKNRIIKYASFLYEELPQIISLDQDQNRLYQSAIRKISYMFYKNFPELKSQEND